MAFEWWRMHHEFCDDQKWRTIARVASNASGRLQRIGEVIAIAVRLMKSASANASERGRTRENTEDICTALDMQDSDVEAILQAMEGRFLEDGRIIGWDKWQPLREDGSASRAKLWREKQKSITEEQKTNAESEIETQPNATELNQTLDKTRLDKSKPSKPIVASDDKFEEFWVLYPKRPGANKAGALKAWKTQIKRGTKPEVMLAGCGRYRAYCDATGKTATEFVKMAATFLGPQNHFELEFELPAMEGGQQKKFDPVSAINRNRTAPQGFQNVPTFDERGNPV